MNISKADVAALGRRRPRVPPAGGATARDTGEGTKRARPRQRPEKAIQRAILDYLATVPGVYAFKTGTGMFPMTYKGKTRMVRMGKVGVADIVGWKTITAGQHIACLPVNDPDCIGCRDNLGSGIERYTKAHLHTAQVARFLAIEVKRSGRDATPEQTAFLDSVKAAGGVAIVAHSVDDVVSALGLGATGISGGSRP